ncbi:helix-turn-helix domain-containing protein [Rhodococcus erythropolis]|uniref:helix-turn-helix domain-containing protein n=1 Tax=Rhodococcus erythropolis TaxID=1833 RepID=UPI001BE6B122|nr:helix-turn-helix domain-containing protein [Rhodococcus erythropolis]MBT2265905.1 helix-turn-helix domain-containing protein [Rhodococcus erythropolis]
MTPSRMLARKLSDNELELKGRLVKARINAGMSVEDVARKLGVEPAVVEGLEASDADLLLSELRHYAYAVNALVHFDVAENWTARVSPSPRGAERNLFVGEIKGEPDGHWSRELIAIELAEVATKVSARASAGRGPGHRPIFVGKTAP